MMRRDADSNRPYVPALGLHCLTPLYNVVQRAAVRQKRVRRSLIDLARIEPGHRVLDVGCGTATLAIMIKQRHPEAHIVGVDVDEAVLHRARAAADAQHVEIEFIQCRADELPFEPASFDRAMSTLVFHHLRREEVRQTLGEMRRVLRPGGEAIVADFEPAGSLAHRAMFLPVRVLDGFAVTAAHARGGLTGLLRGGPFGEAGLVQRWMTAVGPIDAYRLMTEEMMEDA